MECVPLIMEPEAAMYSAPVAVLDFQSLYPSVVIAYNMCFSTALGRLTRAEQVAGAALLFAAGAAASRCARRGGGPGDHARSPGGAALHARPW